MGGLRQAGRAGLAAIAIWAAALAAPFPGCAACDLHAVRFAVPAAEEAESMEVGGSLRHTGVGRAGTLTEAEFRARYASGPWALALLWPLEVLRLDGAARAGMGNPTGQAEYRLSGDARHSLGLGAQWTLPFGNAGDGLASDRSMGMIYASLARSAQGWTGGALVGAGMMLPPMRMGHAGTGSGKADRALTSREAYALAHPHGNREIHYRLAVLRPLRNRPAALSLALEGRRMLDRDMEGGRGNGFPVLELGAPFSMGAGVFIPVLRVPVSAYQGMRWSLGISAATAF